MHSLHCIRACCAMSAWMSKSAGYRPEVILLSRIIEKFATTILLNSIRMQSLRRLPVTVFFYESLAEKGPVPGIGRHDGQTRGKNGL